MHKKSSSTFHCLSLPFGRWKLGHPPDGLRLGSAHRGHVGRRLLRRCPVSADGRVVQHVKRNPVTAHGSHVCRRLLRRPLATDGRVGRRVIGLPLVAQGFRFGRCLRGRPPATDGGHVGRRVVALPVIAQRRQVGQRLFGLSPPAPRGHVGGQLVSHPTDFSLARLHSSQRPVGCSLVRVRCGLSTMVIRLHLRWVCQFSHTLF